MCECLVRSWRYAIMEELWGVFRESVSLKVGFTL